MYIVDKFQTSQVQEWVKELEETRAKYEKDESEGTWCNRKLGPNILIF